MNSDKVLQNSGKYARYLCSTCCPAVLDLNKSFTYVRGNILDWVVVMNSMC